MEETSLAEARSSCGEMTGNKFHTQERSRSQRARDAIHRRGESLKAWAGEGSGYDETSFFRKSAVSVGRVGIWEAPGRPSQKLLEWSKLKRSGPGLK